MFRHWIVQRYNFFLKEKEKEKKNSFPQGLLFVFAWR